jgi:hypothetical protein
MTCVGDCMKVMNDVNPPKHIKEDYIAAILFHLALT